jgi:hypothetical protein
LTVPAPEFFAVVGTGERNDKPKLMDPALDRRSEAEAAHRRERHCERDGSAG